ncbi:putative adhesin [Cupriavidus sp. YR651]|uniref:putative adhesin n=1 Tax=Cupriavidus sp. YR651 TaxID=1855315 RepID=UPI00115FC089|nr:hypothetical protein [Cupriavidus sp. YR651]
MSHAIAVGIKGSVYERSSFFRGPGKVLPTPIQYLVAYATQLQQAGAVIDNHDKFAIIKGSQRYQDKLLVVGHGLPAEWLYPEAQPDVPMDLSTHFDAPAQVFFYCEDGQTLTLAVGLVIAGVEAMPPVVEVIDPAGGRLRNVWLANPQFELRDRPGYTSPGTSVDLLRQAVEYNRNLDADVLVVRTEELARARDIFQALGGIHRYNEIHWLSCRGQ